MADTTTTNLLLTKPEVGSSTDTWGTKINTDLDSVDAIFAAAGTGTSVGLNVGAGKSLKLVGDVIDTNGNELLKVTATASAVNELTLANAATGGAPTLTASGGDTNVGFKLVGKGTGEVTARVNGSDVFNASSNFGFKNRIINGAMVIDQRNAGASVTPTTNQYLVDRWQAVLSQASKYTAQQSSTAPTGFVNSLKITSSSAYSLLAGDFFQIQSRIEGYNTSDLGFGTASAATVTLSFWVQSSLTGSFGLFLVNDAGNRLYGTSYTINAANTWEQKTITIAGDTSGTWATTNSTGIRIAWSLGYGSTYTGITPNVWGNSGLFVPSGCVNVLGTSGATFYITGVQLEKGSTATSFDYRPYGTELALCQRYYYRINPSNPSSVNPAISYAGQTTSTTGAVTFNNFPVSMRTIPTALEQTGTAANYALRPSSGSVTCSSVPLYSDITTTDVGATTWTVASGLTAGQSVYARILANNVYLGWSAEL